MNRFIFYHISYSSMSESSHDPRLVNTKLFLVQKNTELNRLRPWVLALFVCCWAFEFVHCGMLSSSGVNKRFRWFLLMFGPNWIFWKSLFRLSGFFVAVVGLRSDLHISLLLGWRGKFSFSTNSFSSFCFCFSICLVWLVEFKIISVSGYT